MLNCLGLIILICFSWTALAQKLIILHTNDHHGQFMANAKGEFGLSQQATMIKQIRAKAAAEGNFVLVLSGGDINTGAPESNMFKALPDIEAMNKMGYDAMVIGNHEFDIPLDELRKQQQTAKFEFLAANIKNENGTAAFTPYITKTIQGKKIAIVGVSTLETPAMSSKANRPGLVWENPLDAQKVLVQQLKKDHDMVIALSHMGYYPNEVPGLAFPGDESLAKKLPELDLIIGGHSHSELQQAVRIGNTSIVQAKSEGQFLGKIEVDLSGPGPKITSYELMPVKGYAPDPEVAKILQPYLTKANAVLGRKVGVTTAELKGGRDAVNMADSPLGGFAAEANRNAVNADISFVHGRGLRASLPQGTVSLRDLLSVSPFGNTVTSAELNGAEIWKMTEILHNKYVLTPGENTFFSKGFHIEVTDKKISKISLNGVEIPRTATGSYKIATGNFYTEMVPEFSFIKDHPSYKNSGVTEVDAMEGYFKKNPTLDPKTVVHNTLRSTGAKKCGQIFMDLLKALN